MDPIPPYWQNSSCKQCPELTACRRQIVVSTPCPNGGLLAIGEAPGADEELRGEGFSGMAGRTLDRLLGEQGLARQDYGRANICRCRPPGNRKPLKREIDTCLPWLASLIMECRPKVLLLVGGTATAQFMGTGSLGSQIELSRRTSFNDLTKANKVLANGLAPLLAVQGGFCCIPMPHTSPLAFNRYSPSGEKWSAVARQQVAAAVRLVR